MHRGVSLPLVAAATAAVAFSAYYLASVVRKPHLIGGSGKVMSKYVQSSKVLVLHGLTGGSNEQYVRSIANDCLSLGYRVVAMNYRGCNNTHLTNSTTYCAAWTHDVRHVVDHVHTLHPRAPIMAIGLSLGSIMLIKYLAEEGEHTPLVGAMSISNPWDMSRAMLNLEKPHTHIMKLEGVAANVDVKKVEQARNIREIERLVVCPIFGFDDEEHYYDTAASIHHIHNVKIPLLCLNAADDPFAPLEGIPAVAIQNNPHVLLVQTDRGGHVSFLEGPRGVTSYIDRVFRDYAPFLFANSDT